MTPELIAALVTAFGVGAILQEFVKAAIGRWTGKSQRQREENRERVQAARELALDIDAERSWRRSWEDAYYQLLYVAREHIPRELHALIPPPPTPPPAARPQKESS